MYKNFEDMTEKLSPKLRRIAHRMNGHFTFFSDEDLYQEAMIRMWAMFQNGTLDDKTDSYILQGCYFHLKNYLRTTLDKAKLISLSEPIDGGDATLEDTLASEYKEVYNVMEADMLAQETALKGLSKRELEVIRLSVDGLTVREIGDRLGVSHVMVVKLRSIIKEKCRILRDKDGWHGKYRA